MDKKNNLRPYLSVMMASWGLCGVVYLGFELRYLKTKVESMDRQMRHAHQSGNDRNSLIASSISSPHQPLVNEPVSSDRPFIVTDESLKIPTVSAMDPQIERSEVKPEIAMKDDQTSEKNLVTESIVEMKELEVLGAAIEQREDGVSIRFDLKNVDQGKEVEGHVLPRLEVEIPGEIDPKIVKKMMVYPKGLTPEESEKIGDETSPTTDMVRNRGEYYRIKYRLGKTIDFPKIDKKYTKISARFFFRTGKGDVNSLLVSEIKPIRVAGGESKSPL